ncbi:hypothetical protein PIB30_012633 [Stylosanthes scabra]|uniref:Uncharacterized protein n=1 Tax=Stylosanthes scabra TaxID=79078 RepID=A0ABU6Y4B0_9FABA|nr:hypothetical protein [Stylosanthes scabra]
MLANIRNKGGPTEGLLYLISKSYRDTRATNKANRASNIGIFIHTRRSTTYAATTTKMVTKLGCPSLGPSFLRDPIKGRVTDLSGLRHAEEAMDELKKFKEYRAIYSDNRRRLDPKPPDINE